MFITVGTTVDDVDVSLSFIVRTNQGLLYRYPFPTFPLSTGVSFEKKKKVFDSVGQPKHISVTDVTKHKTEDIKRPHSILDAVRTTYVLCMYVLCILKKMMTT